MQCLFYRLGSAEPGIPNAILHGTPQTLFTLPLLPSLFSFPIRFAYMPNEMYLSLFLFILSDLTIIFVVPHDAARIEPSYRCLNLFFCQFILFFLATENRTENIFCR